MTVPRIETLRREGADVACNYAAWDTRRSTWGRCGLRAVLCVVTRAPDARHEQRRPACRSHGEAFARSRGLSLPGEPALFA